DEVAPGLIGDDADVQARFLEAIVSTKAGALRVVSLYLPNGNPPQTDKYAYKLNWMTRLINFSHERLKLEEPLLLAGDYNVIPTAADVRRPEAWKNDALFLPKRGGNSRPLVNLGLTDAIRAVGDASDLYTFWDYQAGAWAKDDGIRIDHLLLSPQAADRLIDAGIDRRVRGWDKPSDHVPVYVDLDIEGRGVFTLISGRRVAAEPELPGGINRPASPASGGDRRLPMRARPRSPVSSRCHRAS